MERLLLLKQFIKNPTRIGALCPSSPALCRSMIQQIGMDRAQAVVELGPGTGVITKEILSALPEGACFFAVEIDPQIFQRFVQEFPKVVIYNRSAEELSEIIEDAPCDRVDAVISGLPWAAFPGSLQERILDAVVENLSPGGYFTTFAYLQGLLLPAGIRFRKRLYERFSTVATSHVVWKNLPPAVVYRCQK